MPDLDTPDLSDVLDAFEQSMLRNLHTAMPGRVESYDASKRTANIQPLLKHQLEDENGEIVSEDYPVLPNVPVLFPGSGPYRVTFPVAVGDMVLIVFCEGSIGHTRATGQAMDVGDARRHHLSHAVAIPGFFTSQNVTAAATDAIVIGQDGLTAQFVALANLVDSRLSAIKDAYDQHIHPYSSPAAATGAAQPLLGSIASTAAQKVKAT